MSAKDIYIYINIYIYIYIYIYILDLIKPQERADKVRFNLNH